jgi:hypothetical protein
MLVNLLRRANELSLRGVQLPASKSFAYFLKNQITENNFKSETLETFARLDDYDVLSAVKDWISHSDKVLSLLAKMIINRDLLRIEFQEQAMTKKQFQDFFEMKKKESSFTSEELAYFIFKDSVQNQAYSSDKSKINIHFKNGSIVDLGQASDQLNIQALTSPVVKHFICYPKKMI